METFLIRALQLVFSLSILVIVHEFGHFMFAKLFGVRVEKFYLFFNPWFSLFKYKPKNSETEYGIGWLPLGGYVKLAGMIDESMDKDQLAAPEQPWEFRAKPAWQRLLIMVGGVLMNFILAFFIYAMVLFHWGEQYIPWKNITMGFNYSETAHRAGFQDGDVILSANGQEIPNEDAIMYTVEAKTVQVLRNGERTEISMPENFMQMLLREEQKFITGMRYPFVVKEVKKDSPAAQANMQKGDSLVGLGDQFNLAAEELSGKIAENKGKSVTLNVYRQNQLMQIPLTISEDGIIGVYLEHPQDIYESVKIEYGFFQAFPAGIKFGIDKIKSYIYQFKYIFTKEGAQSLGGFGTIGTLFPSTWNWETFWSMTAFLSIILAVMNLLPIPALDGGHVMFLLYEVITRRKPNEKFMEYAQVAGMILLFGLLIYANGNDVVRYIFKK
jgi:RIP metalloprotease RseP